MVEAAPVLNKKVLAERKKFLDDLLKRRFFYTQGFEIYGGVAGLYDYGPAGCAIKTNIEQLWREHFILEEDMLEVNCTCLTPEVVLKTSGHVDKFDDLIVKDVKTKVGYRADKLLAEVIEKQLENQKLPEDKRQELKTILSKVDTFKKEEMKEIFLKLKVKAPDTGNELTDPENFNLMFGTQIGPSGQNQGYLRPETAQGIFVNFAKLLEYNNGRMPFAGAQLGLGFRNEIAPRGGLLRVREFQMAEIEHFVDPQDKSHPKFKNYKGLKLPLYSQGQQEKLGEPLRDLSLEDAVNTKIINNETLAYFMARTYLFLVAVGVNPSNLRFRQHMKDEMAHYASDCWDAEIETSSGWIECVGIADRACFDLSRHSQESKVALVAARRLPKPELRKFLILNFNKAKIGQTYKQSSKLLLNYLENISESDKEKLQKDFEQTKTLKITLENVDFELNQDTLSFEVKEQMVAEEKFCPSVIEPSFGIGRILYCMLEHRFKMRDEKRTYLDLPPKIAPVKCSILTVISSPEYVPLIKELKKNLTRAGLSSKVDDGGQSIGRRYARTDEIGIPFGVTLDKQTLDDKTVTLRELNTTKQIRIPIADVVKVISDAVEGFEGWDEISKKYPTFEVKDADKE